MMSQIPPNLENEMAPGGSFPGIAETVATPVGSDKPVRVRIGQNNDPTLSLSKMAYRERSAQQKEVDAQTDESTSPTQGMEMPVPALPEPALKQPTKPKRGRPIGSKNKPKPAAPKDKPIGQPSPAVLMVKALTPAPSTTADRVDPTLDERMARLERGLDRIVGAIAERDEMYRVQDAASALAELDEKFPDDDEEEWDAEDEDEVDDAAGPGESSDKPPLRVVAEQVEVDPAGWDKGLQELQQMIGKRNPQKLFRQYWCQLTRAAQYNEWPPERREAFDETFNKIVAHPKFIHQMSTFMRGSRGGNCIGNEAIARVCGQVAGFLTVYQLAAAGK